MRGLTHVLLVVTAAMGIAACSPEPDTNCDHPAPADLLARLQRADRFSQLFVPVDTVVLDTTGGAIVGVIDKALRIPCGYLVLDSRLSRHVFMFDAGGRLLRKLARHGSGPAEYQHPVDVAVDSTGSVYILDASLRKVMWFDSAGNWLRDVTLGPLGIYPSAFAVGRHPEFLFYCLHPDFPGKGKGFKIVAADLTERGFVYRRAFGKKEKLLQRFFFNFGAFRVDRHGRIWLGEVFTPTILLYSPYGKLVRVIREHENRLPQPLLSPDRLERCKRMTEAVDAYSKCTRLADIAVLDNVTLAIFFSSSQAHFVFFDHCGRFVGRVLSEPIGLLPSLVVGVWANRIYFCAEPTQAAQAGGTPGNPVLLGYTLHCRSPQ